MIRWSITDKKEIFQAAVIDILDLRSKDLSNNEIIQTLSPKYQEKDIDQLSRWINDVPKLSKYEGEKLILKISLWILLAGKLLTLTVLLTSLPTDSLWNFVLLLLLPLVNIIGLIMAYRVTPNSYPVIFMTIIYSLSSFMKLVGPLFIPNDGIFNWVVTLIAMSAFIGAGYTSFKLMRVLPSGLIRTHEIMTRLELKAAPVAD